MRERLFKLFGLLILLGSLAGGWLLFGYKSFVEAPLAVPSQGLTLEVTSGSSFSALAQRLESTGVLTSARYFRLLARLHGQERSLKVGEYFIAPGTTPQQLLQQLVEGRVMQHALTLVEGWSFRQVIAAVHDNPYLKQTLRGKSEREIMTAIGYPSNHPEGRFFPDTYHVTRGLTDVELLRTAYRAMEERLALEWQGRDEGLPLRSDYEALILASIVEKETGHASERPKIAGVFTRRLQIGMRLQTDPTVIYGLGEGFDGNLRRRDLEAEGPYNTYRIKGLPPTPIAMPGREAIHAALHPAPGDELYFVAKGDGTHYFSATFEEHNRAVTEYQLKRYRNGKS